VTKPQTLIISLIPKRITQQGISGASNGGDLPIRVDGKIADDRRVDDRHRGAAAIGGIIDNVDVGAVCLEGDNAAGFPGPEIDQIANVEYIVGGKIGDRIGAIVGIQD